MYNKFIPNFLTEEECDKIIELGKETDLKRLKSVTWNNGKAEYSENEDGYHKRSGSYFGKDDIKNIQELKLLTNNVIKKLNKLNIYSNGTFNTIEKYTFNEYGHGDYLNEHSDLHEIELGATLTVIYQLNDSYEGGEVCFKHDEIGIVVPKEKGSIFIFDSNLPHWVNEVKKGTRYSMNSWPRFQIKQKNSLL
tara:strand:- start:607 stop:1185 length:579 start_codon:yes stop_codon:yes gene_type:complete